MATGRVYRIKKSEVKGYGYAGPAAKKRSQKRNGRKGPGFAANGSVTHIAAINGRGSYRSARRTMSGLRANRRPAAARSSLSAAKKAAFARKMRGLKKNSTRRPLAARRVSKKKTSFPTRADYRAARVKRKSLVAWRKRQAISGSRRRKAPKKATRKSTMARKVRRRKKSAARSSAPKRRVAKRRTVKRRRKAAKKTAAPKRRRRKAKKVTLKANRRRRRSLRRNKGTSVGARKGWRVRKKKYAATSYRKSSKKRSKKRRSRKASAVAPKRKRRKSKRKLSMKKSAVAARRKRRAAAKGMKPNRRRSRRSRRKLSSNRRRRSSRRRMTSNRRRRSSKRRSLSPNRRRRSSRRKMSSNRRRHRRNGRRMFKKNGIGDTLSFIAKTGGLALVGFVGHKVLTNLLVNNVLSAIFSSPAAVVVTPAVTTPATATVATTTVVPATSGLSGISLDPAYQKLIAAGLVAGLGVFASAKLIKDPGTRNTVMTGIAVSFTTSLLTAALMKFAPTHVDMLAGDGTAARLSAMYGLGAGTSLQPRYQSIGRPMGEYFSSGVNGLGEYFSSGVSGLGEYFSSGVSGLGLPAYEAAAGYGANPDFAEAAAGMGARELANTNHVDPHGDLDRELTIAEAAAGVGALPSYEAAAGFGSVSTLPTSSTWIPGSSDGQIWAGTRSISAPQSASEMVPAGILQTDGGQGVFG